MYLLIFIIQIGESLIYYQILNYLIYKWFWGFIIETIAIFLMEKLMDCHLSRIY